MRISIFSAARTAFSVAATSLVLAGCTPDQTEPTPGSGALDLTHYLAVGDSYTAGYADGGLTRASQEYSYPALLARQFALTNAAATFSQPLLEEGAGTGYLTLTGLNEATGIPSTRRVPAALTRGRFINTAACAGTDTVYLYPRAATTVPQNLGVPGMRLSLVSLLGVGNEANLNRTAAGQFNPYFERLLPAADNRSYLQVVTAASTSATFFTYFMGLDELLPYVNSGGSCPLPTTTPFQQNARALLTQLTNNGSRAGVVILPPVSLASLPLLNLSSGLILQSQLRASTQRPAYKLFVRSSFLGGATQPATATDFVLPSGRSRIGRLEPVTVNGTTQNIAYGDSLNPVSGRDVLDATEYTRITNVVTTVRDELRTLAQTTFRLPTVDLQDGLFGQVANGINVNGVVYSPQLVRGNFYSLDQLTLTPRGNAILANTILRAMNSTYGTSVPLLDPNSLPGKANP